MYHLLVTLYTKRTALRLPYPTRGLQLAVEPVLNLTPGLSLSEHNLSKGMFYRVHSAFPFLLNSKYFSSDA